MKTLDNRGAVTRPARRFAGGPAWRIALATLAVCIAAPAWAQFSIDWSTIDGGGATQVTGGTFTLGGTIGQPDAGRLSGGAFVLDGGFWLGGSAATGVDSDPDVEAAGAAPLVFGLRPLAPNPFAHSTVVSFDLPRPARVRISAYDVSGRLARTLDEGQLPAGRHQRIWDGTDDGGRLVAAGIYFVRIDAEADHARSKVVVLR